MKTSIEAALGIQGVHPGENKRARTVGNYISYVVNFSLLLVVAQLVMQWAEPTETKSLSWVDEFVWAVFAIEFIVNVTLVTNKWRYVKNNWLNLAIVIVAAPVFKWDEDWVMVARSLRLILFVRVIFNLFDTVSKILSKNSFGMFLLVAIMFLIFSAVVFSLIEGVDIEDGLWYALVTITTVGYGDIVPKTEYGREFGALMIAFGVVLFSIVTANISAFLVGRDQQRTEHEILAYVKLVSQKLLEQEKANEEHIARILAHVNQKVALLENNLKDFNAKKIEQEIQALEEELKTFNGNKIVSELSVLESKISRLQTQQSEVILQKLKEIEAELGKKR